MSISPRKALREIEKEERFIARREQESITICTQVREALKLLKKRRRSKFLIGMLNVDDPRNPIPYQQFDDRYRDLIRVRSYPSPYLEAYRAYLNDVIRGTAGLEVPRTR